MTILIVDDEVAIRKTLRRTLAGESGIILEAACAQEAFAILERQEVNIILTDLLMPGMNGLEFIDHARRLRPAAVSILMTGDFAERSQAEVARASVPLLLKPWDNAKLRTMVRSVAERLRCERREAKIAVAPL